MQIILLLALSLIGAAAAVVVTRLFLVEKRSRSQNIGLTAGGVIICLLFSVLAEVILTAKRPSFYYHLHRPGLTTLKLFGAACLFGSLFYALALMIVERKKQRKSLARWLVRSFLIAICLAAVLEIGYFNFRHFELIGSGASTVSYAPDRIQPVGFYFNRASWKFHPYNYSSDRQLVTYTGYRKVRNITYVFDDGTPRTNIRLEYNDQAHRSYQTIPVHEFIQGITRSYTIPIHTVGTTYSIALSLPEASDNANSYGILLEKVVINQIVPLELDPIRFGLVFLAIFLISSFFPGSPLWELPLSFNSVPQMAAVILLILICFGFFAWTVFSSYTGSDLSMTEQKAAINQNYQQYNKLVEALMVPQYAMTEAPHRYLEQLDDPYDMRQREGKNFAYPWDTAYFNGRFYVYFGVVPAVTVLLPYRLLTGSDLELDYPILGFCCLFLIGLYGVFAQIVRRCFPDISFGMYWTCCLLLFTSLNLTWCLRRTLVYELAITSGICFAVWGVLFMLIAGNYNRTRPLWLLLSGLAAALAVGCRPTMAFVFIVTLTVGWHDSKKDRPLLRRGNIVGILCFCIPVILVALALMKYNVERFGDPFEFGITWQLTTENRATGLPLLGPYGRLLSILASLFTMPTVDMNFPFIHLQTPNLPYNGMILDSDMILGVFAYPVMAFLFGLPVFRKMIREHGEMLLPFCRACLIAAAGICVTASAYSVSNRYLTDYLFLAALSAVLIFLCFCEKCQQHSWEKLGQAAAICCCVIGVCLFITLSLTGEGYWLRMINPLYYDKLRYAFSPWL